MKYGNRGLLFDCINNHRVWGKYSGNTKIFLPHSRREVFVVRPRKISFSVGPDHRALRLIYLYKASSRCWYPGEENSLEGCSVGFGKGVWAAEGRCPRPSNLTARGGDESVKSNLRKMRTTVRTTVPMSHGTHSEQWEASVPMLLGYTPRFPCWCTLRAPACPRVRRRGTFPKEVITLFLPLSLSSVLYIPLSLSLSISFPIQSLSIPLSFLLLPDHPQTIVTSTPTGVTC